jgi:hypothetical protein
MTLSNLYQTQIKKRSARERLQIAHWILADLTKAVTPEQPAASSALSLLQLAGLGAEIWEGIDAQEYVAGLRSEWDRRP